MRAAQIKADLLAEYGADAFDAACQYISDNVAAGYVRWSPLRPPAIEPKPPFANPVLLDAERSDAGPAGK